MSEPSVQGLAAKLAEQVLMDGVPGVPWLVAVALGGAPATPWRLARYGLLLAVGEYDFGPPAGVRLVVFYEGGALVYFPELSDPYRVQKVHWWRLPAIAARLGVE